GEPHALRRQLLVRLLDVVARERAVEEGADALFVPVGREEDDARLRGADAELDPALRLAHGLVGDDLEAQLLRVEGDRGVLVAGGDADELETRHHAPILRKSGSAVQQMPQLHACLLWLSKLW